jgi:signal transduction histidine kinase
MKATPKVLFSLRTKLVVFISLVIVGVCSGLSWYLVQQQADSLKNSLIDHGFNLVRYLAHNSRYSLITQDTDSLRRTLEGALSVEDVVYVVALDPQGQPIVALTKGELTEPGHVSRSSELPLYPPASLAQEILSSSGDAPTMSVFTTLGQNYEIVSNRGKGGSVPSQIAQPGETVYDFALPIRRRPPEYSLLGPLSLELQEVPQHQEGMNPTPQVYGVIQIGFTNSLMMQSLNTTIWNVVVITLFIILIGITSTTLLANQIITPVRRLATVAGRIADGDLSVQGIPEAHDEVGQLTASINQMTTSLRQREKAISTYVETITRQVSQLATLNQTGVAITSTLDVEKLLSTVLQLLVENLGFVRMVLVFFDSHQQTGTISQITGVSKEMEAQAKQIQIPILDNGGIDAQLLIHGKSVLAPNLEKVADRMNPQILQICREIGVVSFVAAPLKSQNRMLGYLGADRGSHPCTQEDLDLLMTIANHVSIAIDNASSYKKLEQLNLTLEQRVQDRTHALEEANERLREHDRLRSMFVSTVSHELRTPMTSMKGLVENMLDGLTGELTDRQTFYLDRVKHNVERLTRMSNELLDLSRIEGGGMQLSRLPLSVNDLATEAVDTLQPVAREKSLSLKVQLESGIPEISGDRDKLHQVVTNLVNNAIKFTKPGGEVMLDGRLRNDGMVQISVKDTGCGIPPNEMPHIFERFYRGESVAVESRGAGLGLAISKSLVELHGGQIWVDSIPEKGSCFYFTLPIQPTRS